MASKSLGSVVSLSARWRLHDTQLCVGKHHSAKGALTEQQVRTIREMKAAGKKHGEVAAEVGCSYWAVADVASSRTFSWVK